MTRWKLALIIPNFMKNRPRRYVLYLLLRAGMAVTESLPRRAALFFGRILGRSAYYLVARQRNKVLKNLRFAWRSEKTEQEIRAIARKVFENLAMTAVDAILLPRLSKDTLRDWVSFDEEFTRANRILDQGRGVVILTGHIGNWEVLAGAFGVMGYYAAVVGRRIYYEKYNQIIIRLRESVRIRTIYRDSSPKEMLRVLKNNHILGMLADQDVESVGGIFVDFFGHPAYTPTSPVKLAMAAETALVPAFCIREGDHYRLILEEPMYPEEVRGSQEDAVREFTERWSAIVERTIRQYPEQWVWMHDRWKTSPPPETLTQDSLKKVRVDG